MAERGVKNIRIKIGVMLAFALLLSGAYWQRTTSAEVHGKQGAAPLSPTEETSDRTVMGAAMPAPESKVEGCVTCHNNIEPMHRYKATGDVLDKIDENGHDAQG